MSDPTNRPRATIYLSLPTDLYERLVAYAVAQQTSVEVVVEAALTEYLDLVERLNRRSRAVVRRLMSEE